ncbi:hypothetical protein [uncultured Corynebacterium sp.]|uniref:Rv1157c family protein n=1 Tax=uncultured Corynebacterium sp. TaxID=159447 RepID=UPI0025FD1DD4|nr:hypothetical protein [uncultured Corynebacterium sp.]
MSTTPLALRAAQKAAVIGGCAALLGLVAPSLTAAQATAPDLTTLKAYGAGGSASPLDGLGRPNEATQTRVRAFAEQPWVPQDVRNAILSALAFSAGEGENGGPELVQGGPGFTQFYWPTVSAECIGGTEDAMGSAIAVPGPTQIPAPGAGAGEAVFLFTALGTAPAAADQGQMQVQWFNIDTFQFGTTPLVNNGINADGPTTVSGRAATGTGTVIAVLSGTVNTQESACRFAPTATILEVK